MIRTTTDPSRIARLAEYCDFLDKEYFGTPWDVSGRPSSRKDARHVVDDWVRREYGFDRGDSDLIPEYEQLIDYVESRYFPTKTTD